MARYSKPDPRELMELAVTVMTASVAEARDDGKASPLVGAVVSMPDGTVHQAARGELRQGDHAEYTLLERKNRGTRFDGARLFSTLEPCAPGARRAPKVSCAERIVLARIKDVWIGIEDPDPTVDRKGIQYLEDRGVTVHMFDKDLQEEVRAENRDFIQQALERAATEEEEPRPKRLSSLEQEAVGSSLEDFSRGALEEYRSRSGIQDPVDSPSFHRRLLRLGLLDEDSGVQQPTRMGILLFGASPRETLPHAGLLATVHLLGGGEDVHDFDGPLVLIPEDLEVWLRSRMPGGISRGEMQRQDHTAFPFELIREAVVNALVHRDYDIPGAKCHLIVSEESIQIRSPGRPVPQISLAQLQAFSAPVLSRNPMIHYVFNRMGLAEERGLGMKTLDNLPRELGLPRPRFGYEDPYLLLTMLRSPEAAVASLPSHLQAELSEDERAGWQFLSSRPSTSRSDYSDHLGVSDRTAVRHLNHFIELGLLRREGSGPATVYLVVVD